MNESLCVVCMKTISQEEESTTPFECNHEYHSLCIQQWISCFCIGLCIVRAKKATCPLCRAKIQDTLFSMEDDLESVQTNTLYEHIDSLDVEVFEYYLDNFEWEVESILHIAEYIFQTPYRNMLIEVLLDKIESNYTDQEWTSIVNQTFRIAIQNRASLDCLQIFLHYGFGSGVELSNELSDEVIILIVTSPPLFSYPHYCRSRKSLWGKINSQIPLLRQWASIVNCHRVLRRGMRRWKIQHNTYASPCDAIVGL